ncbi:Splicing factor 3B subunit 6 [Tieghemiomyces parasiticus]|uniref:Splicing factor 3B subunit 6 n=1 Tax=Tieghemiomyces parasiticus TaxID=78921 RepID=A0A9W8AEK3_9FUNG|nr:Splicing factor 3B subunit 6 [Tieghemiomyces parasiticus]
MAMSLKSRVSVALPPDVNRILYVRNLPFKITPEDMYDLFGRYGAIRQIRIGSEPGTKGTAFVVYEDIFDAKTACDHLQGFNLMGRYLIVAYYQAGKASRKAEIEQKEKEIQEIKSRYELGD